jgi:Histidine kinase
MSSVARRRPHASSPASEGDQQHFVVDKRAIPPNTAVIEERMWIARELHDSVVQSLHTITPIASRALTFTRAGDMDQFQRTKENILELADCQVGLRECSPSPPGVCSSAVRLPDFLGAMADGGWATTTGGARISTLGGALSVGVMSTTRTE